MDARVFFVVLAAVAGSVVAQTCTPLAFSSSPPSASPYQNVNISDGDAFVEGGGPPAYAYWTFTAAQVPTVINAVRVNIALKHPKMGELVLTLIGPDGTQVVLSDRVGGDSQDFYTVLFDDAAATPIASAVWDPNTAYKAYHGTYRPSQPLSAFSGKNAVGTWALKMVDFRENDIGTLSKAALAISCPPPPPPTPAPPTPAPPPCTGCGDPHMTGLDGVKFDFQGEPDTNFALISDPTLQLNAHFVKGPGHRNSTLMGGLCLRVCNDTLTIRPTDHIAVNGNGLHIGETYTKGKFAVHRSHKHEVEAVFANRWAFSFKVNQHADVVQAIPDFAYDGKVHGVIGHTLKRTPEQTAACANDEGHGGCEVEGDWHDYIVKGDDLCSTVWTHTQFDDAACAL